MEFPGLFIILNIAVWAVDPIDAKSPFCEKFPFCDGDAPAFDPKVFSQRINLNSLMSSLDKMNQELASSIDKMEAELNGSMLAREERIARVNNYTWSDLAIQVKLENGTYNFGGCLCENLTCTCCGMLVDNVEPGE